MAHADQLPDRARGQLQTYFDRTAADAWAKLTSDAPVSGIRATVRAGRDRMRATLMSWLPTDLTGKRLLDAGCGTGALAVEAARRGADVVAIDLSPTLVDLARERLPSRPARAAASTSASATCSTPRSGDFDHVVAMDSLIHYRAPTTSCGCSKRWPRAPASSMRLHLRAAHRRC
ncbi:MAG: methyltransferase domain-containing protein [Burkholderiaceae bacterium]|nr:methyltransferase domain-containing protein [Burkholderiaceae bacterium]